MFNHKNCGGDCANAIRQQVPQVYEMTRGERRALTDQAKWNTKLCALKEFIATSDRLPSKCADDIDERFLAGWINRFRNCGGDCEILLRSEEPQIFGTKR